MKFITHILLSSLLLLTACVAGPPPQSITATPLIRVAAVGGPGIFSADPDGRKVAVAEDDLSLLDLESDNRLKLSSEKPVALAWSPDGLQLAAAYSHSGDETRLLIFSAEGVVINETFLPVSLSRLFWSNRGDLLVTGFKLKVYTFGANLSQTLYRIDGKDVEKTTLSDSTLRPSLAAKIASQLGVLQPVTFSPSGDELVFLSLRDPPEFSPYAQVVYRNWQSDEERPLQRTSLQEVLFLWNPSGDSVDIVTSKGLESLELWQPVRSDPDVLHDESYRFVSGVLYKGAKKIADWGKGAQFQMFADGRFFLAVNQNLYLGDGLQNHNPPVYDEKAWNLRRWRYEGLINQKEFLELLKEKNE